MSPPDLNDDPDIARVAALLGEPARASICLALMDGRPLTAGELAMRANISAQTASNHLAKLMGERLIAVEPVGRNRFYRLARPEVAQAIEALSNIAPTTRPAPPVLAPASAASRADAFRFARTCYDHLAGRLSVSLAELFVERKWLRWSGGDYQVTKSGEQAFAAFGVEIDQVRKSKRSFARGCLDWSERQPHLAGALGAAVLERLLERSWIERMPMTRTVRLTFAGREGLKEWLGPAGSRSRLDERRVLSS